MMRVLGGLSLFLLSCIAASTHEPGEDTTSIDLGKGKVTIHYGTPTLGDRNLDDMIKPGLAWRMGMNNPTTLETTVDLDFGGKKLPAGHYALFARCDEAKNWVLLVSKGMEMMFDPSTVVLETHLSFEKNEKKLDVLKITLGKVRDEGTLLVAWGTYRLRGTFRAAA
jgi:DUF2911 family protein